MPTGHRGVPPMPQCHVVTAARRDVSMTGLINSSLLAPVNQSARRAGIRCWAAPRSISGSARVFTLIRLERWYEARSFSTSAATPPP